MSFCAGVRGLVNSMSAIVIGHFSMDGKLKADHYSITKERHNTSTVNLFKQLIETFSFEGHTVLNGFSGNGILYAIYMQYSFRILYVCIIVTYVNYDIVVCIYRFQFKEANTCISSSLCD